MKFSQFYTALIEIDENEVQRTCKHRIGHFLVALYGNEFDLHEKELVSKTHFHMKGFAPGLVLKQRQTATRKWTINM